MRYKRGIFDWKDNYCRLKKENEIYYCPFVPIKKDIFEHRNKKLVEQVFEDSRLEATKEDIFEQFVGFTFSDKYLIIKEIVNSIIENIRDINKEIKNVVGMS